MGWTNELYQVYNLASSDPRNELLPVSHSTANAQIEIIIDENGEFKGANTVEKEDALTIIPVTEDSGARSSGITPMPYADKLVYIAGDYPLYADVKRTDNSLYYKAYMTQLEKWKNSEWNHPAVEALFLYLRKGVLMKDLINSGVLKSDPGTGKLIPKYKIAGIAQEEAFVRIIIQYKNVNKESRTWKDTTLYDSFIAFNSDQMGNRQLCYATGTEAAVTYKHLSKIRNGGDKAKLISSNDETGFTYRGRFGDKEEAISVSYEFSQKVHNALKWLISRQKIQFGSLTLVTWASALEELPDELQDRAIEDEWEDEAVYNSYPEYKAALTKYLLGYRQNLNIDTKVMILGLDAATTGRLSISMYEELSGSEFLQNIENWHANGAWRRYDYQKRSSTIRSFTLFEIIRAAYGLEQNGRLECEEKLYHEQILRLLPCVMAGKRIPEDLIQSLYHKASNPLSYDKNYNHQRVIEAACGMLRAYKKGDVYMSYDPNETDRSYLYGCLLAIADKAESDTFDEKDRNSRVTNARRYWANFSQHPYQTWRNIEERLRPYLDRHPYRMQVERWIQEIMGKFRPAEFADNRRLDTLYLLGYHHFTAYMYTKKEEE